MVCASKLQLIDRRGKRNRYFTGSIIKNETKEGENELKTRFTSALIFLSLTCILVFIWSPLKNVSANETISKDIKELSEKYDLEDVEFKNADSIDSALEFDTVEEFENFLKSQEENEVNKNSLALSYEQTDLISMFAASNTKTYTFKEYTGVSTITSYAKVTRNSKGVVSKVLVWSSQTGIAFPISYTQNAVDYTLNSTKKNGKAYVYGTKSYGVTVGGQGIAYKKNVTYTVPF